MTPGLDNFCCDRSWPVGFDVTGGQGGGSAQDAGFAVIEFDRQGGLGDVHGQGLVSMDPAKCDLLAADHDHAGV